MKITKSYLDDLTYNIIGCCINVHKELGAGLLEKVYHRCLIEELNYQNISFTSEHTIPVTYRNLTLDTKLRADLFVENCIVLELKSVNELKPYTDAQIITYMKLLKAPKGILVNFNCKNIFNDGQKTFVNKYFADLPA